MTQNRLIALALRGVSKRFDRPAVDVPDLTVQCGEFYALVGPNGAGKTTTALAAAQTWAALGTAAIALGILAGVSLISPSRT
jgi:ABC-2 type transport system ATP-binding protein